MTATRQKVDSGVASKRKPGLSARQRKRNKQNYMLAAPQLIIFSVLTLIPLVLALPLLFTDMTNFKDLQIDFIGVDNFTRLFTDASVAADYWPALIKTVRFTVFNYAMVFVFGLTFALLMYEVGFRGGLFTMIYLPWMVSGLALGFLALMLFSESTGTVNLILEEWGLLGDPINIKSETGTTIILPILVGWKAAGFNMAIFLAGLLSIPKDTVEASIVDGASYRQRLFRVYFPQMIPSFVIATIFALMGSFKVFDELAAMGGLYQNDAAEFLSIIFFRWGFTQNKLALGMTLAVMTFVPLMIVAIALQRYQKHATTYQD